MTNEAKHTPGPWRLHDMEAATVVQSATGYAIADCNATKYSDSENDANARLIASAPALVAENARMREALTIGHRYMNAAKDAAFKAGMENLFISAALISIERDLALVHAALSPKTEG